MVNVRRGRSSLGCLFTLLVIAAVVYFGLPVGEAYVRFYRFEDEMKQAVRFAKVNSDAEIRRTLQTFIDSAGLPPGAERISLQRRAGRITISSSYVEEFHLPGYVKLQPFNPRAEGTY